MTYRLAKLEEVDEVFWALLDLKQKSTAPQMKLVHDQTAREALNQAYIESRLFVCGDYAVLVDYGSPWHSNRLVLIEEIIIRFRRTSGNKVEDAVAALEGIAKQAGCAAIAAGDTQVGLMAPRYQAAGYTTLGSQFYKELNGSSTKAHWGTRSD